MAVMSIEPDALLHPPEVSTELSMEQARAAAGSGSRWAVVVDDGQLKGWIELDPNPCGSVAENVVPFEVQIPLGTSLRSALSEMLLHDVRWIPVVDHARYLGVFTPNGLHAVVRRSLGGRAVDA